MLGAVQVLPRAHVYVVYVVYGVYDVYGGVVAHCTLGKVSVQGGLAAQEK
jgi:hypothetical protein